VSKSEKHTETPAAAPELDAPVTRRELEALLGLQRQEHERQIAILLERLAVAPGVSQDTLTALNERILQGVNVHEFQKAQNAKTQAWLDGPDGHHAQRRCQEWLVGERGYLLALRQPPGELNSGRGGRFDEYSASVVFANGTNLEAQAISFAKWYRALGLKDPPQHFLHIEIPTEQAEAMRSELATVADAIGMDAHAYHARCRVYLWRYLRDQQKRAEAAQDDTEKVPSTLPNPWEQLDPLNQPPPNTFEVADSGVQFIDGWADLRELTPYGASCL
jgi:hypothetical protein